MYEPQPIDTSGVDLTDDLQQLVETLAESVHDGWAKRRIAEGWTLGDQRDDEVKTHPCLVPYVDLPDSEKDIDRGTVELTIKSLVAMGYRVEESKGTVFTTLNDDDPANSFDQSALKDIATTVDARSSVSDMMKA